MTAIAGAGTLTSPLTDEEFDAFRRWIRREAGISLSPGKRALVASRVAKRLRRLGFESYGDYYDHVAAGPAAERQELINCLTTNKTEFLREPHHFRMLRERVFPDIEERARRGGRRTVCLWSAACSTGEEPYTLAITALEHFGAGRGWEVRILASDIDTDVLAAAEEGVYPASSAAPFPPELRRKYFDEDGRSGTCRVRPEVRDLVTFRQINFMDETWPIRSNFDAIFCRNVLIYFDRETQDRIVRRLAQRLLPGGHLMLGHSEGVAGLASRLTPVGGTAYRSRGDDSRVPDRASPAAGAPDVPAVGEMKNLIVGDVFATDRPVQLRTLLGSCVAACVFDPEARVGGMNHVLLPGGRSGGETKYAVPAVDELVRHVVRVGGRPDRLRAKVFGGARLGGGPALPDIGARNVESVKRRLAELAIPVAAERLGGTRPVQIRFSPETGRVFVAPVPTNDAERLLATEADRIRRSLPAAFDGPSAGH